MRRDELIADYLLGELPAGARAEVEARMAGDPAFADAVERMRPVIQRLEAVPAPAWSEEEPPPLPPLPPRPALAGSRRPRRIAVRPLLAVAASVAVLAVGIGVGLLVARSGDDAPPAGPALALARFDDGRPGAHGEARVIGGDTRTLRLDVSGLEPSGPGEVYELWLIGDRDRLMSLGVFRVPDGGAAQLEVPLPVPLRDFTFIDVSVEPEDGNAAHSGVSVLRGPTGEA